MCHYILLSPVFPYPPDQDPDRASLHRKAAMLFWALLASGQIAMRKVGGWQTLAEKPTDH
jgi:hypothetical protein